MEHRYRLRVALVLALIAAMVLVFMGALFRLQVVEGEQNALESATYTYTTTVSAARGEILDRNGVVLVSNRVSYYVTLNSYVLFNSNNLNAILLELIRTCQDAGIDYADTFPMSRSAPWAYTLDQATSTQQYYFKSFMIYRELDPDMKAANLMKHLRSSRTYGIPEDWTDEEARQVIGLRYELDLRYAVNIDPYILAEDLSADELAILKELNVPGLNVETTTQRVYNTTYAAHVLGHVGMMTAEDYETYRELGYPMNARIGIDGVERAFESYLRGQDGTRVTTINAEGQILSEYLSTEPNAGDNVYLSLDIGLQQLTEDTLAQTIQTLRASDANAAEDAVGEGSDAEGGAIVVMDVKTAQVLASASYPTFNLATYNQDFSQLLETDYAPLYNRALLAAYPPGSTYKPVTALAALTDGVVTMYDEIDDVGRYTLYDDFQPTCLAFSRSGVGHGLLNVMEALSVSCNYYFYEVGHLTGIESIDLTARSLGLGEPTGVELSENLGRRANPETKWDLYSLTWYGADDLTAAIGQSDNAFTPMQLACYVSALANRGTRYSATFLNKVMNNSFDSLVYQSTPTVASVCEASEESWDAVFEGMTMAAREGTAKALAGYDVTVAAKTGTASHGSAGSDNAAFVCFAPVEDPQIAIVIYVEKGAAGSALAASAIPILDYYFDTADAVELVPVELG